MVSLESLSDYIIYYSFFHNKRLYYATELCAIIYILNFVYEELKGSPLILEKPDAPFRGYFYPVYNRVAEKYGVGLIARKQIPWFIRDRTAIRLFPEINDVLDILSGWEQCKFLNALRIIDGV